MSAMIRLVHLEDDPVDADLVASVLRGSLSCAIHHVSNEADFRAAIASDPDIILADANLPGFDGLEAQRIALQSCPEVPFIYVTGTLGEEHAVERLTAGATDYILKHRIARLPAAVGRALAMAADRRGRHIAEDALRTLNSELEQRVEERTKALQLAQAQAEQANKAKSEFLSRMSHDLRTPLNAILGFAQLLQMEGLSPDDHDSVVHILKGGRHLLDLINEVLDIARIEAGHLSLSLEPVSIPAVLQHVSSLIKPLADFRSLSLIIELPPSSVGPFVLADEQRLNQVLVNLLSNAVKYNREGGTIKLTWAQADGRVQVSVIDSGFGIAAAKLGRIFTPFERLGAEQTTIEGTGLGLALAKSLVEAMAGTIGVESQVERGSRFWIELPLASAPVLVADVENDESSIDGFAARGVVLYVEDNLANVQLMQRLMSRRPHVELLHAADGAAALELAAERVPDLIFLDLHLPDISGLEVLQQIRSGRQTKDIPVTILSADATPAQKRALLAAGAGDYLTKPFNLDRILNVVDGALSPTVHANRPASAADSATGGRVNHRPSPHREKGAAEQPGRQRRDVECMQ